MKRYDDCVSNTACSADPLSYWEKNLPRENSGFGEFEIKALLQGCRDDDFCSQNPLDDLYNIAFEIQYYSEGGD